MVDSFLGRPLDAGPYCCVWLDALSQKVREDGRRVNESVAVATAVSAEGKRETVGMDVGTSEGGAFWLSFLRSLSAECLEGVELVISEPSLAACAASSKSRVCLYSARRLTSQRQSFGGQPIHADTGLGGVHRQSAVGLRWDAQCKRSTVATRG